MRHRIRRWLRALPGWSVSGLARLAWIFILIIACIAVVGPWIANEKPYYIKLEGHSYFPMFTSVSESNLSSRHPAYSPVDWNTTAFQSVLRAPIPYSHSTIDLKTGAWVSPFDHQQASHRMRHWLGTDGIGRDVLAGMIRGCRISLLIGLGSMLLAFLIGVPLGSLAAYWGNRGKRISWLQFIILFCAIVLTIYIALTSFSLWIKWISILLIVCLGIFMLRRWKEKGRNQLSLPIDQLVLGSVSILDGFPGLFLVVILVSIFPYKGWLVILLVIAFLRWPIMARYMRAEVLKMKESNYIKAAQIVNLPAQRIIMHHIVPYAFRPVMISFIFGIASAILAESSLSFLGIGLPPEQINWGRLLAQSRMHFDAWWLVLFPGCAIFFTLLAFYTIGNVVQREVEGEK